MNLTEQESNPHPRLAEVRNKVQESLEIVRKDAARLCNVLTASECEKILASSNGDEIQKIATLADRKAEIHEAEVRETEKKKNKTRQ